MEKATPVQIRQSLEIADKMVAGGMRFVPMPVLSGEDYLQLMNELSQRLSVMEVFAKAGEDAAGE